MKQKWILGLVLIAAIAGAVFFYQKTHRINSGAAMNLAGQLKVKGPENAKITIVEYSDFQCPACQMAEPIMAQFFKDYPQNIRFIFRHFPLKMHLWSGVAHQAAECANQKGKFWEFHDKLFQTQKEWSGTSNPTEKFLEFAKQLDLNLDQFAGCLSDQRVTDIIQEERLRGEQLKLQSTPTFFVNGERVVGPVELQIKGEQIIRAALGLPPKPVPATPAPAQNNTQSPAPLPVSSHPAS